jgi:hypothetical protein
MENGSAREGSVQRHHQEASVAAVIVAIDARVSCDDQWWSGLASTASSLSPGAGSRVLRIEELHSNSATEYLVRRPEPWPCRQSDGGFDAICVRRAADPPCFPLRQRALNPPPHPISDRRPASRAVCRRG